MPPRCLLGASTRELHHRAVLLRLQYFILVRHDTSSPACFDLAPTDATLSVCSYHRGLVLWRWMVCVK